MVTETDDVVRATGFGIDEMVAGLGRAGRAFVDLLRTLDAEDASQQCPGMAWTAAETAAHMINIVRRGMGDRRRSGTLAGLADQNDIGIGEIATRDPAELATLLEADLTEYLALLATLDEATARATVVRLHAGVKADVSTALSYQLFDELAHGDDIARATGRPWDIPAAEAALVLRAGLPALTPWVKSDVLAGAVQRTSFAMPDAGAGDGIEIEVGEGRYDVRAVDAAEVEWDADPVHLFLALAGRREPQGDDVTRVAGWYQPI